MKKLLVMLIAVISIYGCTPTTPVTKKPISIALGYIENIQFAPFYVAIDQGFFQQAGFDSIELIHGFAPDIISQIASEKITFAVTDGDEIIRSQKKEIPIEPIYGYYKTFPVSLIARKETPLQSLQDIVGKKIGIPGEYGASYDGLIASVQEANIRRDQFSLLSIGYTQVEQLLSKTIDIAVVYSNNEPIFLSKRGVPFNEISLASYTDLVSATVITNKTLFNSNPTMVEQFNEALKKGMIFTAEDPLRAVQLSYEKGYIPVTSEEDLYTAFDVLKKSVELWGDQHAYGKLDEKKWEETKTILEEIAQ